MTSYKYIITSPTWNAVASSRKKAQKLLSLAMRKSQSGQAGRLIRVNGGLAYGGGFVEFALEDATLLRHAHNIAGRVCNDDMPPANVLTNFLSSADCALLHEKTGRASIYVGSHC